MKAHSRRLFLVILGDEAPGILRSQVILPALVHCRSLGLVHPEVLILHPARWLVGGRENENVRILKQEAPECRVSRIPYIGRLGPWAPAFSLRLFIKALRRPERGIILHCRGPAAALQAVQARDALGARVVFDARGASDLEWEMRAVERGLCRGDREWAVGVARARQLDADAAMQANAVVAVSETLSSRLRTLVTADTGKPFAVVPCCVPANTYDPGLRVRYRQMLGIDDDEVLLVHTSTVARWEAFDLVGQLFRWLRDRLRCRLLFLSTLESDVIGRLSGVEPSRDRRVLHIRAAPSEVARYLCAADVGLLLRKPAPAFRVSSPIKFAEYLAAGLAVVCSRGVGDCAEVAAKAGIGVSVGEEVYADGALREAGEGVRRLLLREREATRARSLALCEARYHWNRYTRLMSEIYGAEHECAE